MGFVDDKDLLAGKKGMMASIFSKALMGISGLNKTNRLYDKVEKRTEDFTTAVLEELNVKYLISSKEIVNVPAKDGVIIVSNHPTGGLDGIMLIDAVLKVRKDVKVLGNYLLAKIGPMRKYVISVNPFDEHSVQSNLVGLKSAVKHLENGGALIIFPAGEVATWQDGLNGLRDKSWDMSAVKFMMHARVPIVPVFINARNSNLFHIAGKVNPLLRTMLLPREMMNKEGGCFEIRIGNSVSPAKLEKLSDVNVFGDYLRAMVDYMGDSCKWRGNINKTSEFIGSKEFIGDIVKRPSNGELLSELKSIEKDFLLFRHMSYSVYCVPPERIPVLMVEIGRMREITFRQVGEGTRSSIDTDEYDRYYHQLFIWDDDNETLVGAYRLGFGDEILEHYGKKGLYTSSLYEYADDMLPMLSKSIELGRSFVTKEYQRRVMSLLLLWKGLLYVLLKNKHYRYLIGTVTISGEFSNTSKGLIVGYLKQKHFDNFFAKYVKSLSSLDRMRFTLDLSLIEKIDDMDLISDLIMNIEGGERNMPVLIKKYLQLNSHVIGFDFDPDFTDAIDALIVLDITLVPHATLQALYKDSDYKYVLERFRDVR